MVKTPTTPPQRDLSLFDAVCTMIGIMLGPGIFIAPAMVAAVAPTPMAAAGIWLFGGAIALCGAATYAECASRLPMDGGFFVYYERAFGKRVAQLAGWGAWLVTYPASLTAMAWIAARYLSGVLQMEARHQTPLAAALLLICAGLVALGLRLGAWLQRFLTCSKVFIVLAVSAAGIALGMGGRASTVDAPVASLPITPALALAAFAGTMWTFDGWSDITMLAGQIRNPRRNLMLTALLGTAIPAGCYALLQLAVMTLLPKEQASHSSYVLLQALEVISGRFAATGLGCLALICAVGSLHGVSTAVSRLGCSMATTGQLPSFFAVLNRHVHTPLRALAVPVIMALAYLFTHNFNELLSYFAFTVWLYYALTAAALLRLRAQRVGEAHVWRTPGGMLAPAVVCTTAIAMTGLQFWEHPWTTLVGLSLVAMCAVLQAVLPLLFKSRAIYSQDHGADQSTASLPN